MSVQKYALLVINVSKIGEINSDSSELIHIHIPNLNNGLSYHWRLDVKKPGYVFYLREKII